jgi:hypothetical protein
VFEPPLSIKGRYAVTQDNIAKFAEPGAFEDPLTEVLRSGGRKLLAQAIEAEVSATLCAPIEEPRGVDGPLPKGISTGDFEEALAEVILGVRFTDGIEVAKEQAQTAA